MMTLNKDVSLIAQKGINLLNNSGYRQFSDIKPTPDLKDGVTSVSPLHIGSMLVSYLIGEMETAKAVDLATRAAFVDGITKAFNIEEIKTLCYKLGIPHQNFGVTGHEAIVRELVEYGQRLGRLEELADYCRKERPTYTWPQFPETNILTIKHKKDVAVVISINNEALEGAAAHLSKNKIDCNFVLMTTVPDYSIRQWLPTDEDWGPAVRDFYQTMQHKQLKSPSLQRHFFIAAPMAYAFAIGCVWGLVNQGDDIYQYDGKGGYVRVTTTTQRWKSG